VKVGIIGSTDYYSKEHYSNMVGLLSAFGFDHKINEIISGKNKGAESLAKAFAEDANLKFTEISLTKKDKEYPSQLRERTHGSIISASQFVVVFWNGEDIDVQKALDLARQSKKPTLIFYH
jgi:hypothetical protein